MTSTPTTGSGRKVLVADDDPFHRELCVSALEEAGFTVVSASDGAETLERFEDHTFEIAVVDLTMPLVDGFEVISRLRSRPATEHIPLIVITGHDDAGSVQRAFDLGATSFLAKPLNWPLFVHHVQFVLKSARNSSDLRDTTHAIDYLSRLKTNMMSILANEFRLPLKQIFGFSELLRLEVDGPLGSPLYHEYAADISKSVEQVNVLLLKMLHFGRALSEEIALEEDRFPLLSFLNGCIGAAGDSADRRGVEIVAHMAILPELRCFGDKSLLGQAFRSLVENATKLSPRGASIEITARIDVEGALVFSVLDAGPVLTPNQIHSILRSAGSGLSAVGANTERDVGLTVSRLLVDAHGGQLDLRPIPGEGTMASIVLPPHRLVAGDEQLSAIDAADIPSANPDALVPSTEDWDTAANALRL
jgi:two-component system, sensor histidine kinase and response regulator